MILIAPDKFKGTYSSEEICELISGYLHKVGITEPVVCRPLSDGGEGASLLFPDAQRISQGYYAVNGGRDRLAVSSELVGFEAFAGKDIPLMQRSSYALGEAMTDQALTYVAVGGTATADGGAGFLQALGIKFFDHHGQQIEELLCPSTLHTVASVDKSAVRIHDICGLIDVKASLCTPPFSSLDFAPQKALPGEDISGLQAALAHFHSVLGGESPWDGAGGGLGYALASVLQKSCASGAYWAVHNPSIPWDEVSMVITGEGHVDRQTFTGGKLVDEIYRESARRGLQCLVTYGICDADVPYPHRAQILDEQAICKFVQKFLPKNL